MYVIKGNIDDQLADKIGLFWALLVLLVSLIFRKYFYICGCSEEKIVEVKESYTAKKKPVTKKQTTPSSQASPLGEKERAAKEEDEIKIYVEKEIK